MELIAALYVENGGCYYGLPGVDPWDAERDARLYAGPWPVVAHPPCERWGKYWSGGPGTRTRYALGDDGGCAAAALASVRRWGGVLEHPADSRVWDHFGLNKPPRSGGWVNADDMGGWTCCVDQGHYGHPAQKATWLLAYGVDLPSLPWGKSSPEIPADRSDRWKARAAKDGVCVLLSRKQRRATPPEFRDLLLGMARSLKAEAA
jgi:hypothetical protein